MASSSNQIKKLLKKKTSCLHYFKLQNSVFRSSTQNSQFRCVGNKKIPYSRVKKRKILHSKIPPHPPNIRHDVALSNNPSGTIHYAFFYSHYQTWHDKLCIPL